MGINNSPRTYPTWWLDRGRTGCVRPRAHGKPSGRLWWRDRVSGTRKAVTVHVGCAGGRGNQGEDNGAKELDAKAL